jgi:hypothetical protein
MMVKTDRLSGWARRNWFLPLLAMLLAIEFAFARATDWSRDGLAELVVVFDMCLFVPAIFIVCYRRKMALKPLLIRAAALVLAGIYIASKLVPADAQVLLAELFWARYAGWVVIALFELWVVVATVKLAFGGASARQIAEQSGAPPWIARLMQLEARFWKAVWRFLCGR